MAENTTIKRTSKESGTVEEVERIYGADCPVCTARISVENIRLNRPFVCASCGASLEVPRFHARLRVTLALFLTTCAVYAFGFTGIALVLVTVLCFFPVLMLITAYTQRRIPPKLKVSERNERHDRDYRSVLYAPDEHGSRHDSTRS